MKPEEALNKLRFLAVGYEEEIGQCSGLQDKEWRDYAEMCKIAIEALKKQIPKKVKNIRFSRDRELAEHNIMEGECPECGETMTGNTFGEYCGSCGIALDWGY